MRPSLFGFIWACIGSYYATNVVMTTPAYYGDVPLYGVLSIAAVVGILSGMGADWLVHEARADENQHGE